MTCAKSITLLLVALAASATRVEASEFFCVAEEIVGFAYSPGRGWHASNFNSDDEKFVIRKFQKGEMGYREGAETYGFFELGADSTIDFCEMQGEGGPISCNGLMGDTFFAPSTGRFIRTFTFGYWLGGNEGSDTPYIMRGRCSKI